VFGGYDEAEDKDKGDGDIKKGANVGEVVK
jgi:hypothetical protein